MSHTRSTEHSPQCSTPLPLSPTPPEQTEPAFSIFLELQNSPTFELPPPGSTSGRVLTHAIRAAATDGSPVAGFVAAAALRTRTVAARTLRTRHAGGRVIRSGTPPRSCGSCPRVRRYGIRPLGIQASCSAAARIRTASATSPTFPKSTPARRRNAARARSADYRCHTPPPRRHSLRRGRSRDIRAPRRLPFHALALQGFGVLPAAALGLKSPSGGIPLAGESGS